MCLSTVTNLKVSRHPATLAYKVFSIKADGGLGYPYMRGPVIKVGEWIKDYTRKGKRRLTHTYPKGFHSFKTREGARQWANFREVVRPVMVRGFLAIGTQGYSGECHNVAFVTSQFKVLPTKKARGKK